MQTLHWRQGMRKEMEMEEEKDQQQQQRGRKIINSCVKAHNKTCIRTRLLHLLLQLQGEEKAFLIGHHLGPKNKFALFQNSNKYINLFFNLSISCLCRKPSPFFFFGGDVLAYLVQEIEEKGTERLWSPRRKQMGVYWNWGIGEKKSCSF